VKQGPKNFVEDVASEQIMAVMYKILKKRYPARKKANSVRSSYKNWVGELAAHMIREWAVTKSRNQYPVFLSTYHMCITQGIRFPDPRDRLPMTTMQFQTAPVSKQKPDTPSGSKPKTSQVHTPAAVPPTEVSSATTQASLLTELINSTKVGENIKSNEIASEVVSQLKTNVGQINKLVSSNLTNEKRLAQLLEAHEQADAALKAYEKACRVGGQASPSESESESDSDDLPMFSQQLQHYLTTPLSPYVPNTTQQSISLPPAATFSPAPTLQANTPITPIASTPTFTPGPHPGFASNPFMTGPGRPVPTGNPFATVENPFATRTAANPFGTTPYTGGTPIQPTVTAPTPNPFSTNPFTS